MKLGLGTYALAWSIGVPGNPPPERPLDAEAFLRFALGHGFRLVQMADNQPLPDPAGEEGGRFLETARREGVAIEIGGRGLTEEYLRR
ncbi:MAG: sugar phosphate isomerase/epimerase, partial [Puniceicoccaceae bacterium]